MKLKEINLRDPFVLPEDGKYYLYGSRGSSDFDKMLGFDVYVSNDLENWSNPTEVFSASEDFWATKCFWAPEVHKYQGKYYMLYCNIPQPVGYFQSFYMLNREK